MGELARRLQERRLVEADTALIEAERRNTEVSGNDDLIKRIAMDIGKQVVEHIEHAYPAMFNAVSDNAKLSVRNATYNAIIAAGEAFSQGLSEQRIAQHAEHRKVMRKFRKAAL